MRQQRTEAAAIEAEIAHLRSLALDALRRRWRVTFGRTPPAALSKDLLGRMIAWRMQEQAFGGLDRDSLKFLDGLARHGGSPRRHWQGATYTSLSAIARAITGTAWSGPRFFALARRNGTSPARSHKKKCARVGRNGSHPATELNNASLSLQPASHA
jgi:Protein of unknown function (DUF2924)